MSEFSDHFSQSAPLYALHRPTYPASLFEWLAHSVPVRERAWDCGTGSGQAAVAIASHFNQALRWFDLPRFYKEEMERNWTLAHLSGYMDTWSAVARYRKANGESPVGRFVTT